MRWLRLVGSSKLWVSFAEYSLFGRAFLQKRLIILRNLVIVATPYLDTEMPQIDNEMRWIGQIMSPRENWARMMRSGGVARYVAVCCSVLQCVAVCCSVLPCVAVCCRVLQCVAVCCSVLQCVAVCCSVLQCVNLARMMRSGGVARYVAMCCSGW